MVVCEDKTELTGGVVATIPEDEFEQEGILQLQIRLCRLLKQISMRTELKMDKGRSQGIRISTLVAYYAAIFSKFSLLHEAVHT